jgi:prepilin-type N-terminal cleavage/methylation domain-containing protein
MTTGTIAMVTTEKGFTLSEALVAIVVLSLGLLGLERMHIAAIQVNTIASRLTQATTLAQDRAEQLMALPYDHAMLADTTENTPQGYTISWKVITDPSTGIKTINISVTWKNRANELKSELKTFNLAVQKTII